MSDSIKQSNNKVNGDLAGKNIYKIINTPSHILIDNLNELYTKLQEEISGPKKDTFVLEKFNKLKSPLPDDKKDLATKLNDGNRSDIISRALRGKHDFYKRIQKLEYYVSAQRIFEILLAKVITLYELIILPKIKEGESASTIDTLIYHNIVKEIENILGNNDLNLDNDDILNMVYFLTGNCHIKWSKDDNL